MNDNSSFRWCFCPDGAGDVGEAGGQDAVGGFSGVADEDIGSGVEDSLSVDEARSAVEAQATSPATQAQLDAQREAMSARSAAEKAEGLQDLMDMGIYGYNDAVNAGFLDAINRANQQSDMNLARSIADNYGLDPTQVQPGFMQDPSLGPQTVSYTGPGAFGAAATEVGRGAANLASLVAETYPGFVNFASIIAEEEFGLKTPSLGLKEGIDDYFDKVTASQRETNRAARGITETEQASSIDRSQPQSSTDYFDAPQTLSQQVASAPEQAQSAVDYYDVPTSKQQSSATNFFSDIPDGNEIIPRTVSKTPAAAPTPEPEVKVVREPVTRTPATDTFSILANIYGPEAAAQLLPNRIIA